MQTEKHIRGARVARQFYRMPPRPCPYLRGRIEQNIFTELTGVEAARHYDALSRTGFRRSHGIAYRPACPGCAACVPVRTVVERFRPSKSLRRVWNLNADISGIDAPPMATREQFDLFARYLASRHSDGEMAAMTFGDYEAMVQDTPLDTVLNEFRDGSGALVGGCLTDRLSDGLSAVYSFFDPNRSARSLGTFMVLWLIARARAMGLPYVYLGYWIGDSPKMAYKARFAPLEGLGREGWRVLRG